MRPETADLVGRWACDHWRTAARKRGVRRVAAQLRRQGIPLFIAIRLLGIKSASNTADSPQH
jgi:hypothetical protein